MSDPSGFAPLALGWLGDHQDFLALDAIHVAVEPGVEARWEPGQGLGTVGAIDQAQSARLWQCCQEVLGPSACQRVARQRLIVELTAPTYAGLSWQCSWVVAVLRAMVDPDATGSPTASAREDQAREILRRAGVTIGRSVLPAVLDGGVTHAVQQPARFRLPCALLPGHLVLIETAEPPLETRPAHRDAVQSVADQLTARLPGFSLNRAPLEELHDGLMQLGVAAPAGFWEEIHQRDLTQAGRTVLEQEPLDPRRMGELVDEAQLRRQEWAPPSAALATLRPALLARDALCVRWAGPGTGGLLMAWTLDDPEPLVEVADAHGHAAWVTRVSAPS